MTDLDALLRAILIDPTDDTARLVYADCLEERGQPGDAERAEFIRVQVALAAAMRMPICTRPYDTPTCRAAGDDKPWCELCKDFDSLFSRERELLARHGAFWGAELPLAVLPQSGHCTWTRGFI